MRTKVSILALISLLVIAPMAGFCGPALADFDITIPVGFEASGIVWHPRLQKVLVIDDGGRVLSMEYNGTNQSTMNLAGDLEGICVADPSTDMIYVGVEFVGGIDKPAVKEFNITSGTTNRTFYLNMPGATASVGLEALTFVPDPDHQEGGQFYAGQQSSGTIYTYDLPIRTGGGDGQSFDYNTSIATSRGDIGGLHFNQTYKVLLALFDGYWPDKLQILRLDGTLVREKDIPMHTPYDHNEGICDDDNRTVFIAREDGLNEGMVTALVDWLDLVPPRVVSLTLTDPSPTKAGNVTFTIGFNENMSMAVDPNVTFGPASPFKDHRLTSLGWLNGTHWQGYFIVDGATGDGLQQLNITEAEDTVGNVMLPQWNRTYVIDTIAPLVDTIDLSHPSPVHAGTLEFTIGFDEVMNTSTVPIVTFGPEGPYEDHALAAIGWANDTHWQGTVDITDQMENGPNNIKVRAAKDLADNIMLPDWDHAFVIDTVAPLVVLLELSDPSPTKAGNVTFTMDFNEAMDRSIGPTVTFGPVQQMDRNHVEAIGWSNGTHWTGWSDIDASTGDGLQMIRISDAFDISGNVMAPDTERTFIVDTELPKILSVTFSRPSPARHGPMNLTIEFDEEMDTQVVPSVTFGPLPPHDMYTVSPIGWDNATHWRGTFDIVHDTENGLQRLNISNGRDLAGNVNLPDLVHTLFIDTTPPRSWVDNATLPAYSTTLTFDVPYEAVDPEPGSGPAAVELYYRVNHTGIAELYGEDDAVSPMSFTAPHDGIYELFTVATDNAGNKEVASPEKAVIIVDTQRPFVTMVVLSRAGPYNSEVEVDITFNEPVNGTALAVTFGSATPFNDHEATGEMGIPYQWHGTLPITMDIPSGTYTISIHDGTDIAGNPLTPHTSTTFEIDTTRPVIASLTFDRPEPVDRGTVNFTVVFTEDMDRKAPLTFELTLDGTAYEVTGSWTSDREWKGAIDIKDGMKNGTYTIVVAGGRDMVGNAMFEDGSHSIDIELKGTAPPPPPPGPTPGPHDDLFGEVIWWLVLAVIITVSMLLLLLIMHRRRRSQGPDPELREARSEGPSAEGASEGPSEGVSEPPSEEVSQTPSEELPPSGTASEPSQDGSGDIGDHLTEK